MKLKKIKDQVVVVAGATSGIGRETALQFAKKGARVVAAGRSMEALESLVAEIRDRQGEAIAVEADVSQYDQMQKLADQAVRTYGRIDTWVHAAAVTMYARFEETKDTPFFDKALTRPGVKPAPLSPIYEAKLVADTILYASEHPTREIYSGGSGKSLSVIRKFSNVLADWIISRIAFEGQRSDQVKLEGAPNNLFHHQPGFNTVSGSNKNIARSFSIYNWLRTHLAVSLGLTTFTVAAGIAAVGVLAARAFLQKRKTLLTLLAAYRTFIKVRRFVTRRPFSR